MCCVFFVCVLLQTNDLTKTHAYFYDSLLLCITKVSLWYARSRFESHFGFSVEAEKKHSNREKCCPLLFGPLFRAFTIPVEIESEMRCNQFRMCVYVNVTQWKLQHNDRIKFSVCLLTTTSSRPLFWRCLFSSRTWKGTILVTLFWTLTHNTQN